MTTPARRSTAADVGAYTPASQSAFRTCAVTGRRIHDRAEPVIKANAVTAIVFLLVGTIAAVLLVLTRWQAVHLLSAVWYYRLLGVHAMSMLIFFIIFFEMAVLHFASTVLLSARNSMPKLSWAAYALMLGGALLVDRHELGRTSPPTDRVRVSADRVEVVRAAHQLYFRGT